MQSDLSYTDHSWANDTQFYRLVDSEAFRSDCIGLQADLELHCLQIAFNPLPLINTFLRIHTLIENYTKFKHLTAILNKHPLHPKDPDE